MQSLKYLCAIIVTGLLFQTSAWAYLEGGSSEIQVQGSLSMQSNNKNDNKESTVSGQFTYNYFFTTWMSIGGTARLQGTHYEREDSEDSDMSTAFLLGRLDFYINNGTMSVVPYIGVHAGLAATRYETDGDESNNSSSGAVGGHGGLKIFPTENTSWNIEGDVTIYQPDLEDSDNDEEEYRETTVSLSIGWSYYF